MSRVYKTKGPDAKTAKLTVPITESLHQRVVEAAQAAGLDKTSLARQAIEAEVCRREQETTESDS